MSFCMFFFFIWLCVQQSYINMVTFPPRLVTFPGCFTNIGHLSITNSIFSNITPKTGTQMVRTKVLLRFRRQCIPLNARPDFNLYNQQREACTAIMKKFDDMKGCSNQNKICVVIAPELLFCCIDMLYPCVSGNWNPECGSNTSPSTTDDLWD